MENGFQRRAILILAVVFDPGKLQCGMIAHTTLNVSNGLLCDLCCLLYQDKGSLLQSVHMETISM